MLKQSAPPGASRSASAPMHAATSGTCQMAAPHRMRSYPVPAGSRSANQRTRASNFCIPAARIACAGSTQSTRPSAPRTSSASRRGAPGAGGEIEHAQPRAQLRVPDQGTVRRAVTGVAAVERLVVANGVGMIPAGHAAGVAGRHHGRCRRGGGLEHRIEQQAHPAQVVLALEAQALADRSRFSSRVVEEVELEVGVVDVVAIEAVEVSIGGRGR